MIDYIKGTVAELTPAYVVVDNHGVGYMVNISLTTYNQLHDSAKSGDAKVYVYEAIREDAHVLYGFAEKRERELCRPEHRAHDSVIAHTRRSGASHCERQRGRHESRERCGGKNRATHYC